MILNAVYSGNTPSAFGADEAALGLKLDAVSAFTGGASWSDYDSSVGWVISQMQQTGAGTVLWSIPLIPTGASLATAATGGYDSHYTSAAEHLAASQSTGSIYVRTGWEFNGSWENWSAQSSPATYVAAYQQFVDSYRAVSDRFVFTWCPNVGSQGMADVSAAYPGDAYVDYIGVDIYDDNRYMGDPVAAWNADLTEPYGLNWLVSFAAAHHKQLVVPEWGVNGNNDAAFVKLATAWMKANHVVYESYWDNNAAGFNGALDSTKPLPAAAFVAAFAPPPPPAPAPAPAAVSGAAASAPPPPVVAAVAPAPTPAHGNDFEGDGKSDVLWHNNNGTVAVWESSNGLGSANAGMLSTLTNDWKIQATGDFDGDGQADILWRQDSGSVTLWESSKGLDSHDMIQVGWVGDQTWQIQGAGDFEGDGKADILWTNTNTGQVVLWVDGLQTNTVFLGQSDTHLQVQGIGDFDGDGKADILWRNTSTGDVMLWESSKGLNTAHAVDLGVVSLDWKIQFVGDFDGDGKADILWRNVNTGDVGLWESSKGLNTAHYVNLGVINNVWKIVGVGDYDGDHKTDILWENTTTHDYGLWESTKGLNAAHFIDLGVVSPTWQIATAHYDVV